MIKFLGLLIMIGLGLFSGCDKGNVVMATEDYLIEDFTNPHGSWEFIADTVMGGVSTGKMELSEGEQDGSVRMSGNVSLENNGGFIQIRRRIAKEGKYFDASGYEGVRIEVKGDGNEYAVHLRNSRTWLPWQFYQAMFETTGDWQTIELPFEGFKPYYLKKELKTSKLKTVAIVALFKEFKPNIEVRKIMFYAPKNKNYNTLTPQEREVIIEKGTERPFTGEYYMHFEDGTYHCKQCGAKLFESDSKFESRCGWPSFDDQMPGAVKKQPDADGVRTEIVCSNCGGHLGHIFYGENLTDKNQRYCVNSISLNFQPAESKPETQRAIFAGGCFWGIEYGLKKLKGVMSTTCGYIGGNVANPTYQQVCSGKTGHAEAVEVVFDSSEISYEQLTKFFMMLHDSTQLNRQGPDIGTQYRSEIFYTNSEQKQTAAEVIELVKQKGLDVKTKLTEAGEFYPAEEYHQDYFEKTGKAPYCHTRKDIFD